MPFVKDRSAEAGVGLVEHLVAVAIFAVVIVVSLSQLGSAIDMNRRHRRA